jgi:hypothetical protein
MSLFVALSVLSRRDRIPVAFGAKRTFTLLIGPLSQHSRD